MPSERVAHNALDILRIKKLEREIEVLTDSNENAKRVKELERQIVEKHKLIDAQGVRINELEVERDLWKSNFEIMVATCYDYEDKLKEA